MKPTLPKVIITDKDTASDYLLAEMYQPTDLACVLSINDRESTLPVGFHEFGGHKIALFFEDVTVSWGRHAAPDADDARKIVAWAKGVNGTCLVHCRAGISRSTAAAIAIPAVRSEPSQANARAIMRWLVEIRYVADPNPLLVALLDDEIGWNGHLYDARAWRFPKPR